MVMSRVRIQNCVAPVEGDQPEPDCTRLPTGSAEATLAGEPNPRHASATREPLVHAVASALCREWGEDPDETVPVCDEDGQDTGLKAAMWTLFRSEALAAITAFIDAEADACETDACETGEVPAFLADAEVRSTG